MRYILLTGFFFVALFGLTPLFVTAQIDNVGSGRAIQFDGVDDYIDYGSVYHDLNLPFTISAWVYLDPSSGPSPIFTTNDNDQIYRGFWFFISPTDLWCEFGDGTGGNQSGFRRGKQASLTNVAGRWVNVSAVMTSPSNITLYVNGIDIGGFPRGDSNLPMASSFAGDIVKSGYFEANGGVIYKYKGMMDEIRLWNRSLSKTEVQMNMCKKLTGAETGLIGYWNFDETSGTTIADKSARGYNGQLKNNPTRVFSGAPIGDDSNYQYPVSLTGTALTFQDGDNLVTVKNVKGNPEGIHIYEVKSVPSQVGGLNTNILSQHYFGVYAASAHIGNSFDVSYEVQGAKCHMYIRPNNSTANWTNVDNPALNAPERAEIIGATGTSVNVNLGADKLLCNQSSVTLSSGITDPQVSILWSTGQTTSSIDVSQSGLYSVTVSGFCGGKSDSVTVSFEKDPPSISLGEDQTACEFIPITLSPLPNTSGYIVTWQDGSTGSNFKATDFGKYWVTVKNDCGSTSDTITFSQLKQTINFLPNVITPNGDDKNQFFKIDDSLIGNVSLSVLNRWGKEVYRSSPYKNDWDGADLSPGIYYMVLTGSCIGTTQNWLTIIR
ncbi:MAG TPA: LamG-like jellyroll fold domain-containing protein [Cyclobacteriaceae bacterium]|nr:LamG-like jellyroll fold domain-containing protein [Cyclobacteriaceae bacterium]